MENISDASNAPLQLKVEEKNTDFYLRDFSNLTNFNIKDYVVSVRGAAYYKVLDKIINIDGTTRYLVVNIENKNIFPLNPTTITDIGKIDSNGKFQTILF